MTHASTTGEMKRPGKEYGWVGLGETRADVRSAGN